ncbi:SCO family protein [Ramlibacter sp. PS3R-8]|uniref:SCO family protein n=1 Tax=Ramlibacter sp. PS3R-8 TaxID=3133437 RepID=UPI0030967C9E
MAIALLAAVAAHAATGLKAGVFEPPRMAPQVALSGSDGRDFELARLRGKVVLLSFGFTSCPAVCPTTLATLAQARAALGAAGADVQVVFVSVDPERDTVPRLKAYVSAFDPTFLGATGSPAAVARALAGFGASASKVASGAGYGYDHTSSVFLIDRQGRLVGMMPFDHPVQNYVHDLRLLLAAR